MPHWEIALFFFTIAILYSSVGFGGGSSYLAILALYGLDYRLLRFTALLCNIIVVSGGVYIFYKNGHVQIKKILPLVFLSVPFAFLGGSLKIQESTFFIILGFALIVAALLMLFQNTNLNSVKNATKNYLLTNSVLGGSIGFLSGLVGIGGGIFLAPILHLIKWDQTKVIAATASFFILVNSIAGLSGQLTAGVGNIDWQMIGILVVAVFLGGQIGSHLGAIKFNPLVVRRMTAVLVLFVGGRILWKYF